MIINRNQADALRSIFVTFMALAFTTISVQANSFSLYVGQSAYLPVPKCPISSGYVNSFSYSCSSTALNVVNRSGSPGSFEVLKYFEGQLTIECFFQYIYYINNIPHSGTSREYHFVSCKSNDISIDGPNSVLDKGKGMQMTYSFAHSTFDATPEITWKSSSSCARVDLWGYVTAVSKGTATITASSNLGSNKASFTISITDSGEGNNQLKQISIPSKKEMIVGEKYQFRPDLSPKNATNSLSWTSNDFDVVNVTQNGSVTALKRGTAVITVRSDNGLSASCDITVKEDDTESPDDMILNIPEVAYAGYSYNLKYGTRNHKVNVTWKSSTPAVATISSSGKLTAKKEGETTITATSPKGREYSHIISIVNPTDNLAPSKVSTKIKRISKSQYLLFGK